MTLTRGTLISLGVIRPVLRSLPPRNPLPFPVVPFGTCQRRFIALKRKSVHGFRESPFGASSGILDGTGGNGDTAFSTNCREKTPHGTGGMLPRGMSNSHQGFGTSARVALVICSVVAETFCGNVLAEEPPPSLSPSIAETRDLKVSRTKNGTEHC